MLRKADARDLPEIVLQTEKFYKTTSYVAFAEMNATDVIEMTETLIDQGVLLVYELNDKIVGIVGLIVAPFMFNKKYLGAYEIVWWVDPEYQGAKIGQTLLAAVEPACKKMGVRVIQMVHLHNSPPQAAALYERLGYHHSESSYTKVV